MIKTVAYNFPQNGDCIVMNSPGNYTIQLDGTSYPSGLILYSLYIGRWAFSHRSQLHSGSNSQQSIQKLQTLVPLQLTSSYSSINASGQLELMASFQFETFEVQCSGTLVWNGSQLTGTSLSVSVGGVSFTVYQFTRARCFWSLDLQQKSLKEYYWTTLERYNMWDLHHCSTCQVLLRSWQLKRKFILIIGNFSKVSNYQIQNFVLESWITF